MIITTVFYSSVQLRLLTLPTRTFVCTFVYLSDRFQSLVIQIDFMIFCSTKIVFNIKWVFSIVTYYYTPLNISILERAV